MGVRYFGCSLANQSKNMPSRAIACQVRALQRICVETLPKVFSMTASEIRMPPEAPSATVITSVATHGDSAIFAGGSWNR